MENTIRTIIVDDEPLARKGLSIRLKQFEEIELVAQCSNGEEALDIIREMQPRLVFLDIQMPGLNGLELVQELQIANRVIFVTAYHQKTDEIKALNPIGYLLKPFDDDKFHQVLKLAIDTLKAKL